MKKWMVLAASLMMSNIHAEQSWCGYKDYFRIYSASHPGVVITRGYSDQDVILQILGPHSFEITDSYQCHAGYALVTVGDEQNNWCVLDIKDGPLINHPVVHASCNGLRYVSTQYDGFNTYSYTIYLD